VVLRVAKKGLIKSRLGLSNAMVFVSFGVDLERSSVLLMARKTSVFEICFWLTHFSLRAGLWSTISLSFSSGRLLNWEAKISDQGG